LMRAGGSAKTGALAVLRGVLRHKKQFMLCTCCMCGHMKDKQCRKHDGCGSQGKRIFRAVFTPAAAEHPHHLLLHHFSHRTCNVNCKRMYILKCGKAQQLQLQVGFSALVENSSASNSTASSRELWSPAHQLIKAAKLPRLCHICFFPCCV
jgi:hypothetical protein